MKYWLFDGEDIIGPFSPQEIAARAGYSDSILVCPENQSEDENAWQTAAHFTDFTQREILPKTSNKNLPSSLKIEKEADRLTSVPQPTPSPRKILPVITSVPISNTEGEESVLETKSMAEEKQSSSTNASEEILSKEKVPNQKEQKKEQSVPQETAVSSIQMAPLTEKEKTGDTPAIPSENEMDQNELSLHSLPILGVSESTLPPLPAGDITFYTPSKEPAEWDRPQDEPAQENLQTLPQNEIVPPSVQTPIATPEQPHQKDKPKPQEDKPEPQNIVQPAEDQPVVLQPAVSQPPVEKTEEEEKEKNPSVSIPFSAEEETPEDFFAQTISSFEQIPPELVRAQDKEAVERATQPILAQTEPTDFIPQKTSGSGTRFLFFMGVLLVLLLVLVATGYWLARTNQANRAPTVAGASAASTQMPAPTNTTPSVKTESAQVQRPDISVPPPAVTVSPLQEKALKIVKNYQLSNQRGTVETHLNKLYASQLSQGYQASWSAEPLHKSTYIVKYRLTKTRTEPVMYVFQVDTSTEKLTGALNNITLDLVGKI